MGRGCRCTRKSKTWHAITERSDDSTGFRRSARLARSRRSKSSMLSELRNSCPVARIDVLGHTAWLVTRFDDVKGVLSGQAFQLQGGAHLSPPLLVLLAALPQLGASMALTPRPARFARAGPGNPGFIRISRQCAGRSGSRGTTGGLPGNSKCPYRRTASWPSYSGSSLKLCRARGARGCGDVRV